MEIINLNYPIDKSLKNIKPSVMTIGFFDGVHLAHQRLINRAKLKALSENMELSVMTFYPHPRKVINQLDGPDKYITPLTVKSKIFSNMGVDRLYIVNFTLEVSNLTPECFINKYLLDLNVYHVFVGYDFKFGYKGQGDITTLQKVSEAGLFTLTVVNKMTKGRYKVGSSLIRELIFTGKVCDIPKYLGDFYSIKVEFSLLNNSNYNLDTYKLSVIDSAYLLPKKGVYIVEIELGETVVEALCVQPNEMKESDLRKPMIIYFLNLSNFNISIYENSNITMKWLRRINENVQAPLSKTSELLVKS